ncbi:DNA-methyltransferase [Hydrogenivirga sp.]
MIELGKLLNRVIHGDVLEVLREIPSNSIDLGITSPPYNKKGKNKGWLVDRITYAQYGDNMDEDKYQEWQVEVLNELYRVIKEGGSFFYNHKLRWERGKLLHPYEWVSRTKWTLKQEIIWHRKIAGNIRGWRFWQVDERIYWLYKPKGKDLIGEELKSQHAKFTSVWEIRPENGFKEHPAPFPIELPARIILSILDDRKGIVIDPFCGIGTTLVAAKLLGHDYIGIDISEEYVKFAEERLRKAEEELDRVLGEKKQHTVNMTFEERKRRGYWDKKKKKGKLL